MWTATCRDAKSSEWGFSAAGGSSAITRDELWAVFLFHGERRIRFETAAAARFIRAGRTDNDQFLAFDQTLRMNRGISAANANRKQLGNLLRDGQKPRHGFEGPAAIVRVQAGNDDPLAKISKPGANIDDFIA